MHSVSIVSAKEETCVYLPVECIAIVQLASVPVRVMWQLGRDTSHVPAGLEYPTGVRLGIDQGFSHVWTIHCFPELNQN